MGNTPSRRNRKLEKAIQGRKLKRVKTYLRKGADPNAYSKKSNYSFLSMAITLREEELVKLLLQKCADPNQKSWLPSGEGTVQNKRINDDEYPIHIAAAHGHVKIMEALLNSEIDINIGQDHKLGTALHQAARFGHSKLAELLLANGADIIGIDSRLNIPLHIAATFGQTKVAETLIRYGSPINTSNMKSWTPLHYASSEGAASMTKLLLRHGADAKVEDGTGKTPIDVVKSEDVLRAFLEYAIENEDDEEDEEVLSNGIIQNPATTGESLPPKPARTFVFSSSKTGDTSGVTSRGRTQSQGVDATENSTFSKLKSANSYSDFGKCLRKVEISKSPQNQHHEDDNCEPMTFRRTKSTPTRRQNKDGRKGKQSDPKTHPKSEVKRTNSCREKRTDNHSEHRRTFSVQYRKPIYRRAQNDAESQVKIHDDEDWQPHRRTKSTPATQKRHRRVAKTMEVSKTNSNTNLIRESARQTKMDPTEQHDIPLLKPNNTTDISNSLRMSLSHSLHNLSVICEEINEQRCDANANYTPNDSLHRTKSDGRSYHSKKRREIWIKGHWVEAKCQLNGR